MANRSTLRARRSLVAGALILVGAVVAPSPAGADDGATPTLPVAGVPSVADVVAAAETAGATDGVEAIVDEVLGEAAEPSSPTTGSSPAPGSSGPAPVDTSSAPDDESAETGSTATDTASEPTDTTADTPTREATPSTPPAASSPTPTPTTTQVAPTNVNVSIRIGSPGDNGSVTQANVAVAAGVVAPSVTSGSTTPSAGTSSAASSKTATTPVSPSASPAISPAAGDAGVWNWQWDCISAPNFSEWYSAESDRGIAPSTWIWNWNCGENATQYQSGSSDQHRPVNVNVGIRIASPGNDGPVTQTNIAVAIGIEVPHVPTPAAAPGGGVADAAPGAADSGPGVDLAAPDESASPVSSGELVVAAMPVLEDAVEPTRGTLGFLAGVPLQGFAAAGAGSGSSHATLGGAAGHGLVSLRPVSLRPWSLQGAATGSSGSHGHGKGDAKVARWRPPAPQPGGITRVSSGTSVAPASVGGSSSGGLPLVLALPFLAAVLDMARRLALDRVATPSGHRSRVPDDPG